MMGGAWIAYEKLYEALHLYSDVLFFLAHPGEFGANVDRHDRSSPSSFCVSYTTVFARQVRCGLVNLLVSASRGLKTEVRLTRHPEEVPSGHTAK